MNIPTNVKLVIFEDGCQAYYKNGVFHREEGPALIYKGNEWWYLNGLCHREDGPAIILDNGTQIWKRNDKTHREGGPAIIKPDGTEEFWVNGEQVDQLP